MEQKAYPMDELSFSTERDQEPDWFRIGRDAIKVMARLSSMRELDFYLRHPEPFIRLHAIRRVAGLLLPDAIPALAKRLEDPLENEQNRDEAGWAIRRICRAKEIAWFAQTPWTDRYDGTETASERYGVILADSAGTATDSKPHSPGTDEPVADEVLLRIQMEEANPSLSFSVMPWFVKNSRYLALAVVKALANTLILTGKTFLHLISLAGKGLISLCRKGLVALKKKTIRVQKKTLINPETQENRDFRSSQEVGTGQEDQPVRMIGAEQEDRPVRMVGAGQEDRPVRMVGAGQEDRPVRMVGTGQEDQPVRMVGAGQERSPSRKRSQVVKEPSAILDPIGSLRGRQHVSGTTYRNHRRRKGGQSVFRLLFYPVRLVKNHWVFTLLVLLVFYTLLGFSQPGRRFVLQLNPGAQRANDRLVAVVRAKTADYLGFSSQSKQPSDRGDHSDTPAGDGTLLTAIADPADVGNVSVMTTPDGQAVVTLATVSAPKGLNLRETPTSSGNKIVLMKQGDQVTLLGITQKDTTGEVWQTVQHHDRVGWAMDKWLSPLSKEASNGGS